MTPNRSEAAFDREGAREKIIDAALPHVPFDGWTPDVLRQAAVEAGFDPLTALRIFPGGPVEAVVAWVTLADRRMIEAFEQQDVNALKMRERIASAVRLRLEALAGKREAVRRALGLL